MRNLLVTTSLIILGIVSALNAQSIEWSKTFGGSNIDEAYSVQQTTDGGYILVGTTEFNQAGDDHIWLIKTDLFGNEEWSKTYEGAIGWTVDQTSDNGFIISSTGDNGNRLIKTDSIGNLLWSRSYNGGTLTTRSNSVEQTEDGGYILGGLIECGGDTTCGWGYDVLAIKADSSGNLQWEKHFNQGFEEHGGFATQISDGGYIVRGDPRGINDSNIWLMRLDSDGNTIWWRTMGGTSPDFGYEAQELSNGKFALVGATASFGAGSYDGWLLLIDTDGTTLWSKTYGGTGADRIYSIEQTIDNGLTFGGYTGSFGAGLADFWLLRTDSVGDTLWTRTFGGDGDDRAYSLQRTNDHGYILAGTTTSYGAGSIDAWLVKIMVEPKSVIISDSLWFDINGIGFAEGLLDGASSYHPEGASIVSYSWVVDDSEIGVNPQESIILPTGSHPVTLKVTDSNGHSDSISTIISVLALKIETEGSVSSGISSIGDSLFFASSTDDKIYHFDKDGNIRWSLIVGGDIQSTTTVGPSDRIYVGSSDTRLYAFNLNGNFEWDLSMGGIITASPAVTPKDILFVGINTGRMFSINGVDGSINWNYLTDGPINSSASISDSGVVYFGSDDGKLYALNPDGTLKWVYATGDAVQSSPALDTLGNVYFGNNDGSLYSLNPTGSELWSYTTGGAINSSPIIGADGTVYFGSADSSVYAVSSIGQLVWSYKSGSPVNGTGALSFNGILYIGTDDGKLLALSSTGEMLWYYQTGGSITAPPLITADNMIYVGSGDGAIYGMVDPNLLGLGKRTIVENSGQWPTFQQNNQRTGQRGGDVLGPLLSVALLANPIIGSYYDLYVFSDEALQATPVVKLNDNDLEMNLESQVGDYVYHSSVQVTQSGMNDISVTASDLAGNESVYESSFTFGKLAFNAQNQIVHYELGITLMVPGNHLATEGNLLFSSLDISGNLKQIMKLYPSLIITTKHPEGDVFIIETNALFSEDFKLSFAIKENEIRTFQRLTASGWEQLESYTDETRSAIWAYSSEPGIYGILEGGELKVVPTEFNLSDAFPNPFNLSTTIRYVVPVEGDFKENHSSRINLNIYNIRGQLVKNLVSSDQSPGQYDIIWNGANESGRIVATGIYLMRLSVGDNIATKKLTVLK